MSSMLGNKVRIQIFGQSHSDGLGVVIDGLPAGETLDFERINAFLQRRAGGKNRYSTARKETDQPNVISGLVDNVTCGAPLCALFENKDTKSKDYSGLKITPRPSHADYTAAIKHHGFHDIRGGGHFSGRLTLPLCFAGAVCQQILERRGIFIGAHILSVGNVQDEPFDSVKVSRHQLKQLEEGFPVLNPQAGEAMVQAMEQAANQGDSLGGVVETAIIGLPAGYGDPMFDTIEGRLAYGLFGIPAVKGVSFGAGFAAAAMTGSTCNDPFCMENGQVKTKTNHSGGVQGGISNGMPIVFQTAFKPTPSIFQPQETVNLETKADTQLQIEGRHDPCIVPRAVPCVTALAACVICDILLGGATL